MDTTDNPQSAHLVEKIRNFIGEKTGRPVEKLQAIGLEQDLLASAVLDSLAFVELVSHLEDKTGILIDFTELDPSQVTTINGLVNYLLQASR